MENNGEEIGGDEGVDEGEENRIGENGEGNVLSNANQQLLWGVPLPRPPRGQGIKTLIPK